MFDFFIVPYLFRNSRFTTLSSHVEVRQAKVSGSHALSSKAMASSTGKTWRLPKVKELASIADRTLVNPAIDSVVFPATPANSFWSASPYLEGSGYAWGVYFSSGFVGSVMRNYAPGYARLVRATP